MDDPNNLQGKEETDEKILNNPRVPGVPGNFWQKDDIDPSGSNFLPITSFSTTEDIKFTGPPKVFPIDDHPMVYHSVFQYLWYSITEKCHLCTTQIQGSGYRCETCKTNLCSKCSSKDVMNILIPPTFFHKEYHVCELKYCGNSHLENSKCGRCLKTVIFGFHCDEHKYYLCLLCWHNFVTKATAEKDPTSTLSRHLALKHLRSADIFNTPKSPRSMDPEQQEELIIKPTAPAATLLPNVMGGESPSLTNSSQIPSRKAPLPRQASSSNPDEQMFLINVEKANGVRVADATGLSDPYCVVQVKNGNQEVTELRGCSRTETRFFTLDPVWNCNFLYQPVDVSVTPLQIIFQIYDYDRGWDDDFLGNHSFKLSDPAMLGKTMTFPLYRYKKQEGTITYTCSFTNGLMSDGSLDPTILEWRYIVEYLGYFPIIPTYYQRFKHVFFVPNRLYHTNSFFTVQNTSILEHSYVRGKDSEDIEEDGKFYEINFKTGKQICKSNPNEPNYKFLCAKRLELWYFKDNGDVWKQYDDVALTKIWRSYIYKFPTLPLTIGKNQYLLDLNKMEQKNLKTGSIRALTTESCLEGIISWFPNVPEETSNGNDLEILDLSVDSEEYQKVFKYFYITMPSNLKGKKLNTIVGIQKIVNPTLRKNWAHELDMCRYRNKKSNLQENDYVRLLWHGTSGTNPKIIYQSDKGWKLNYAGEGNLWGKGLYFSQDAVYSAGKYAFTTNKGTQILLCAELIVGDCIYLRETKDTKKMKDAPAKKDGKLYDCVIGNRHNTWIYVTYDSSRAYPTYMVEYYPDK